MDEIVRLQYDLEKILDKNGCSSLENLALLSNKALADSIKVNGTKAYFLNQDEVKVDLTMTPKLVSTLNQKLIQSQTDGTLSPSSNMMYEMGEQISLTTKIIHVRSQSAQNNSNSLILGVSLASSVALLAVFGFILYKKNKKAQRNYSGVQNQETIN